MIIFMKKKQLNDIFQLLVLLDSLTTRHSLPKPLPFTRTLCYYYFSPSRVSQVLPVKLLREHPNHSETSSPIPQKKKRETELGKQMPKLALSNLQQ